MANIKGESLLAICHENIEHQPMFERLGAAIRYGQPVGNFRQAYVSDPKLLVYKR